MYKIKLTEIAAENLKRIDMITRNQIINKIETISREPLLIGKALKGFLKEYRSVRAVGQRYRIIYRVFETEIVVVIVGLGIRKDGDKKDIYELMKRYIRIGLIDK